MEYKFYQNYGFVGCDTVQLGTVPFILRMETRNVSASRVFSLEMKRAGLPNLLCFSLFYIDGRGSRFFLFLLSTKRHGVRAKETAI